MFRNIWITGALVALAAGLGLGQPNAVAPNGSAAKRAQVLPLLAPDSAAARLMLASPQQREQFLRGLPAERQEKIQEQLAWFDNLPDDVKQLQIARLRRLAGMPKEQRTQLRAQIQAFRALPQPRRQAVRRALIALSRLPESNRTKRMNAPAFRSRFSERELTIISELSEVWPPSQP